jgi:hypothetical protein
MQQGHVSWKAMSLYLATLSPYPVVFWVAYLVGRSISEGSEVLGKTLSSIRKICSFMNRDVVAWTLC